MQQVFKTIQVKAVPLYLNYAQNLGVGGLIA
jgi:hypothetical protein